MTTETKNSPEIPTKLTEIAKGLIDSMNKDTFQEPFDTQRSAVSVTLSAFAATELVNGAEWRFQNQPDEANKFLRDTAESTKLQADHQVTLFRFMAQQDGKEEEFTNASRSTALAYQQATVAGFNAHDLYRAINTISTPSNRVV